jgi:hypothetical protein
MSSLMEWVLLAATLASLVMLVVAWRRFYRRLRAKGRGRPFIISAFSFLLFGCLGAYTGVAGEAPPGDPRAMLVFIIPTVLWIVFAAMFVRVLPGRGAAGPRVAGRRTTWVPYRFFGWVCNAVAVGFIVFMIWQLISPEIVPRADSWRLLVGVLFALGAAEYFLRLGRRIEAAPTALPRMEGSVLYLRAFGDERLPFVSGPSSVIGKYTDQFTAKVTILKHRSDPTLRLTLDDFLGEAIAAHIGPFVALGNPVDTLPPDGAMREYAPDARWKERFAQLAADASCLVIAFGESENLEWELAEIRRRGMSQKLCVLTPPLTLRKNEFGALRKSIDEARASRTTLASTWTAATEVLRRAGYDCDAVCPGFGAAVMFDEAGKSMVLTTEASTPAEYVAPIADWVKTRSKSGRHVETACLSCGTRTFQPANSPASADAARCFVCRGEAKTTAMSGVERTFERYPVLAVLWAIASLAIAAVLATALSVTATWFGILVWAIVFSAPWLISAAAGKVTRGRSAVRE